MGGREIRGEIAGQHAEIKELLGEIGTLAQRCEQSARDSLAVGTGTAQVPGRSATTAPRSDASRASSFISGSPNLSRIYTRDAARSEGSGTKPHSEIDPRAPGLLGHSIPAPPAGPKIAALLHATHRVTRVASTTRA